MQDAPFWKFSASVSVGGRACECLCVKERVQRTYKSNPELNVKDYEKSRQTLVSEEDGRWMQFMKNDSAAQTMIGNGRRICVV